MTGLGQLFAGLVLRPAARDRLRFALTVTGIAIGVATVAAIRLSNASVMSSFSNTVDLIAGKASLTVLPDGPGIPEDTLRRLSWLRRAGVATAPAVSEIAAVLGREGEIIEVYGVDPLSDETVREYSLSSGASAPALATLFGIFEKDALIITRALAERLGLRQGDTLTLVAQGRAHGFKTAAVLEPSGPAGGTGGAIAFGDISTVQDAFGKTGLLDRIDLVAPPGTSPEDLERLSAEITASLPPGVTVGRPERRTETVDRMVRAFRVNLTALGLIALLVGVYFVYNTLSISVLRRRTEIGTVRALGVAKSRVFTVFILEGLGLGLAGSLLGIGLGVVLARLALILVGGTATEIYLPSARPELAIPVEILITSFLIGIVASGLSALAPAWEAARVNPATVMRHGSVEASRRKTTGPLAVCGVVFLGLGWLATRAAPVNGLPVFGFASVFLIVAGTSLLAPLLITLASRLLDKPATALLGVAARVGRSNLTGSLSRTAVAVAALTMGVSMMVSVAVMVGSFRDTVVIWIGQTLRADLFLSPLSGRSSVSFGRFPQAFVDEIAAIPGVKDIDAFVGFSATRDGTPFTVASGDYRFIAEYGNLPLVGGGDSRKAAREARVSRQALISEPFSEKFGVARGDVIEVPGSSGPVKLTVAGVYVDYSNDRGTVTVDREYFRELFGMEGANSIAVVLEAGLNPEEGARRIQAAVSERYAVRVRTNRALRQEALRVFDRTFAVTYALELVAIAVAVLGVFNTLVALVLERRREIGLLRVLGASARNVKQAVRFEAAAISTLGIGAGFLSGGAMSYVLIHVINRQSFGWTINTNVPWLFLSGAALLLFLTTLLASIHPARLAAATDAATVLKEE